MIYFDYSDAQQTDTGVQDEAWLQTARDALAAAAPSRTYEYIATEIAQDKADRPKLRLMWIYNGGAERFSVLLSPVDSVHDTLSGMMLAMAESNVQLRKSYESFRTASERVKQEFGRLQGELTASVNRQQEQESKHFLKVWGTFSGHLKICGYLKS